MLQVVIATTNDLNTVAELAKTIWNIHYVPIIGQEQVDYMLDSIYNYDCLVEQLEEKKHLFYLIKKESETIGFLSISSKEDSVFFLHKFYINSENAHSGIGTTVLNELENMIKPNQISLTVNRENYKSINFYFKNGFKIESVQNFDIGNGFEMNDFVMVKTFD